jgi:hypothetical protein
MEQSMNRQFAMLAPITLGAIALHMSTATAATLGVGWRF